MAHKSKSFSTKHGSMSHKKHRMGFGTNPVSQKVKFAIAKLVNKRKRILVTDFFDSVLDLFKKEKRSKCRRD